MVGQPADAKDDNNTAQHTDDLSLRTNEGVLRECCLAYSLTGPEDPGHEGQGDDHRKEGNEVKENEEGDVVAG